MNREKKVKILSYQKFLTFLSISLSIGLVYPAQGICGEFTVFEKTYIREKKTPKTVSDAFSVLNPDTNWTLRVENIRVEDEDKKDKKGKKHKKHKKHKKYKKISSAVIHLNGNKVVKPKDFKKKRNEIEKPVTLLPDNILKVTLRSKPDAQLTVKVTGQDNTLPVISNIIPADRDILTVSTPSVSAEFTDDISGVAGVQILIDGNDITAQANVTEAGFSYTPVSPLSEGPHTLSISVSDNAGNQIQEVVSFRINQAPILNTIGNQSIDENGLLTFTVTATDPDGDALTYSATNLPTGASFDAATQIFTWTPDYTQAGSYTNVNFEVTDGVATDAEDITITVNDIVTDAGLVAYYPFNGNANDESGNGHDGTVLGGAVLTTDRFGNAQSAFSFDGVDDYIKASATGLPTAERTVSVWFYADMVTNHPPVLGYGGGAGCGTSWLMMLNVSSSGSFQVQGHCNVNKIEYAYADEPIGAWYHLTVTTDVNGTKMYVNGEEKASNTNFISNTYVNGTDLAIGVIVNASGIAPYTDPNVGYFNGKIDDIRIYDRAFTPSEIQFLYAIEDATAPMIFNISPVDGSVLAVAPSVLSADFNTSGSGINTGSVQILLNGSDITAQANVTAAGFSYTPVPSLVEGNYALNITASDNSGNTLQRTSNFTISVLDAGLVAYYPFNGNANDESGNGNNGTVNGAVLATDRFGNADKAYFFNGTDNYIIASADGLPTGERTVSVWFYANMVTNHPPVLGYGGGAGCGTSWLMMLNVSSSGSFQVQGHCNVNKIEYAYADEPIGAWYHLTVTTDVNGTKMYVNGEEKASNTNFISNTYVNGTDLAIGVIVNASGIAPYTDPNVGYFNGKIDDIRIYGHALSNTQILALYEESTDDTLLPVISNITPADGSVLSDKTPEFSGNFIDEGSGIDVNSVQILVDANDITAQANITATGFNYTPLDALSEDSHTLSVNVSDKAGNTASVQSRFEIANTAPVVDTGQDFAVFISQEVYLNAAVTDDGLPEPPGSVSVQWSRQAGPGTVTFADSASANTMVVFSVTGTYVLRLTADDGVFTVYDEITITVNPEDGQATIEYEYDSRKRLITVIEQDAVTRYTYDASGNRIQETVETNSVP